MCNEIGLLHNRESSSLRPGLGRGITELRGIASLLRYDFCCGFPPEDPRFVRACFPEAPPPSEAAAGDAGEEDPDADVEIRACSQYGPVSG